MQVTQPSSDYPTHSCPLLYTQSPSHCHHTCVHSRIPNSVNRPINKIPPPTRHMHLTSHHDPHLIWLLLCYASWTISLPSHCRLACATINYWFPLIFRDSTVEYSSGFRCELSLGCDTLTLMASVACSIWETCWSVLNMVRLSRIYMKACWLSPYWFLCKCIDLIYTAHDFVLGCTVMKHLVIVHFIVLYSRPIYLYAQHVSTR